MEDRVQQRAGGPRGKDDSASQSRLVCMLKKERIVRAGTIVSGRVREPRLLSLNEIVARARAGVASDSTCACGAARVSGAVAGTAMTEGVAAVRFAASSSRVCLHSG